MARGAKIGCKRKTRNNVRLEKNSSDESDEDYRVDEDEEFNHSEDDYCSSLAEDESEDSLGEFNDDEEEEWGRKKATAKKVGWTRRRNSSHTRKKNTIVKPRKKRVANSEVEDEEECVGVWHSGVRQQKKNEVSRAEEEDVQALCQEDEDDFVDENQQSLGEFIDDDDEEEWVGNKATTKKGRTKKSSETRKKNTIVKPRKIILASSEEEDEEECVDFRSSGVRQPKKNEVSREEEGSSHALCQEDEDDFVDENPRKKSRVSRTEIFEDSYNEDPKENNEVSYSEEKEDCDYDVSDDSDDEEFTPDEELTPVEVYKGPRRKRAGRRVSRIKNGSNLSRVSKAENPASVMTRAIKKWQWGRRKKAAVIVNTDSDSVSSEPSDYEYTISEEEREQVIEATALCKKLKTNLRSSSSLKMIEEENSAPLRGKHPGRKGKQKVVDLNIEIGKQVCGICLSEESKKTVRGVLNCCSHYFCFACIMEWSKVESRCPLCKQRFATISRTARTDGGHDLRDAVFPVPERDQVYQPSEEELRGYLDPYENVLCSECLQGGDDALMLLCDLCDSPAHTFCVGLGREVPDGNWYCDGCRPTALASSNAQGLNPTQDHGASNNLSFGSSPGSAVRETFDLNEAYVPDTPLSQVNGHSQSPRNIGHLQPTSPASGSGAFTLHDRRRIQRVIHELINSRSRQPDGSDGMASASAINLFGSPIGHGIVATQNTVIPRMMPPQNLFRGRLASYNNHSSYNREAFSPRLSNLRGEALQNQASTSNGHTFDGLSQSEYAGMNARTGGGFGQQQLHPCSATSNPGADASSLPFQFTEATVPVPSRTMQGSLHTQF